MRDSNDAADSGFDRRSFLKAAGGAGAVAFAGSSAGGARIGTKGMQPFTLEYVDVDGDRKKKHFMPIIDELNSKYDAQIKLQFREIPYNNMKKQLLTRIGAGNAPDVAAIDQIWLGAFYKSGKLMSFNDMQEQINFSNYFAGFQEAVKQDGNIVGFPITTDVRGMYWHKDMFEKAGLDPNTAPKTWSEFYKMGKKLHNPPKTYGTGIITAAGIYSVPLFSAGGQFLTSGGSKPAFQKPSGVKAAKFFDKIYNGKSIGPSKPVTSGSSFPQEFLKGTYATTPVYGSWMDYFARQQGMTNEQIKKKYGFGLAPHPSDGKPATMMGGFAWSAFKTTERPDIVRDFMKRISKKEFNRKIARKTGRIPTRKSLLEAKSVWKNILWSDTIKDMLQYGGTRPVNNWSTVSSVLTPALQRVAFNKAEPKPALQQAATKLKGKL